jgi:hypothetical protein
MSASPKIIPLNASPGMHVRIGCPNCRNQIEFFLRGGLNRLQCVHCREATEIDVVHDGQGWAALPAAKEQR